MKIIRLFLFFILSFLTISLVKSNDVVFFSINASNGLSDNQIRSIHQLPDGRLVFTTSGNINIYDGANFTYLHRTDKHVYSLTKYDGFYRVYQSTDSLLWIKDNYKLFCLNLSTEQYMDDIEGYFKSYGITKSIEDLFIDDDNRIWLLTHEGLLKLKKDTYELFTIVSGTPPSKLQDVGSEGNNLYLFYNTGKVVCYDIQEKKEKGTYAAYTIEEQEKFKSTSMIVKTNNGFYQLRNGNKGGFFFFDSKNKVWKKILETHYVLNTLIITQDGIAYISCAHGIWKIDLIKEDSQYLPVLKTVDGEVINTEVSTIFCDKQGGLWLGTLNRGLLYYHPFRYKFLNIGKSYFSNASSQDIVVQSFEEDKEGNIYVKSNRGVYRYQESNSVEHVLIPVSTSLISQKVLAKLNKQNRAIFRNKQYASLCFDKRGWVWAGTTDGLKLIKPKDDSEQMFYTEHGLCNNFIQAIYEDRNSNIWVTTSYGISKINVVDGKVYFTNFSKFDGLLEGEYSRNAIFEDSQGVLYFGGIDGFNVLYPEKIKTSSIPFKPSFVGLKLHGESVKVGEKYDNHIILAQALAYTKKIDFLHNQNFLTFEFSALNYQNQQQTFFRYQLEGVDTEWIETSSSDFMQNDGVLRASYTNLLPGSYVLKVIASNDSQRWEGEQSELAFTIHAPWWRSTTAYIIYVSLLVCILVAFITLYFYWTKKKLERQHREDVLLLRVRSLIKQCNRYEEEQKKSLMMIGEQDKKLIEEGLELAPSDNDFLLRAIKLVEQNLDQTDYNVEKLSRDLCMDRTGLYRKLIALLDKSPSLFIRSIRLQRAAQLIIEDELSVAEIADRVGFSSSSYLSKCFQEQYGCRPTEYAKKSIKST